MSETPNNKSDFIKLWSLVQPTVASYLYSAVRQRHDSEDLLQEVSSAAYENFDQYDSDRSFAAWVMGIARYRILKFYQTRSRSKLQFDELTLSKIATAHENLHDQTSSRREALHECVKKLQPRGKKVLQLRYMEAESVNQIAMQLGATTNAVSVLLYKIRTQLKRCIEQFLQADGGDA